MNSILHTSERKVNADHRFGEAEVYYPIVVEQRGRKANALFTASEITHAIRRAKPARSSLWKRLLRIPL